ncbi:DUF3303 family protein [Streptomyces abikoensis]|uniref:DUF3303 family protein n=1 Tax=Streptomyces abikoensis TaxID=97398 RepID=UPI00167BFA28|nr:DUF3303 family protein [Streptomyces abikoensis]GGP39501.1 hypothetical protein GCM10010214_10960 [Streptomyces abikoensis]
MRMLLIARLDTHTSNEAIRNGTMPKMIEELLEHLKPEAAYFTVLDGGRSCVMVFNLEDPSHMPAIVEKFFLDMEADVELHPVMNTDDLRKGLAALGGE